MSTLPLRKPTLLDMMLLIAATAVGLVAVRYYATTPSSYQPIVAEGRFKNIACYPFEPVPYSYRSASRRFADLLWVDATSASLVLAVWSPAVCWFGFRPPRPGLEVMVRRPGLWASAVASAVTIVYLGWHEAEAMIGGWPTFMIPVMGESTLMSDDHPSRARFIDGFGTFILPYLRTWVGPSVATAWLMLFASGNWRPSADWGDRSGRLLGLAWIVVYLASPLTEYPFP
jgi:hypothetical protein